jgi:hypothetical protein
MQRALPSHRRREKKDARFEPSGTETIHGAHGTDSAP